MNNDAFSQKSKTKQFRELSCPEKWWVIWHPFVAKKAHKISVNARNKTDSIQSNKILLGTGNGDQVDAFRHAFWMATLSKEIGWNRAKRLGKAHEKGNYKQFKKGEKEDGKLPDQMSCTMDVYNNIMGLGIGMINDKEFLEQAVIDAVKSGYCKIIKTDATGNYLNCEGTVIPKDSLVGKWKNDKCLIPSNEIPE